MTDAKKSLDIAKAYVPEQERVLDPTLIDASVIDRLPQPTGWRVLIKQTWDMSYVWDQMPTKGRTNIQTDHGAGSVNG